MSPLRGLKRALLLSLVAVLAGCVGNGVGPGGDRDKALQDHVRLGLNYIREGNRQMARSHLQRAMEIDSRSPRTHHAMALLLQTELEYELAEEHYRKAIAYDRDFTRARNNYAVFLFGRERFEDAYEQFEKAGEDIGYRNRHQVFYSLGVVASRLGRDEEARAAWVKAIALAPSYAMPRLELAALHLEGGELSRARQYLEAFDKLSQPVARSLWLEVQLAARDGDRDAVASKGLALTKLFPGSPETRQYQMWLKNDADK